MGILGDEGDSQCLETICSELLSNIPSLEAEAYRDVSRVFSL